MVTQLKLKNLNMNNDKNEEDLCKEYNERVPAGTIGLIQVVLLLYTKEMQPDAENLGGKANNDENYAAVANATAPTKNAADGSDISEITSEVPGDHGSNVEEGSEVGKDACLIAQFVVIN